MLPGGSSPSGDSQSDCITKSGEESGESGGPGESGPGEGGGDMGGGGGSCVVVGRGGNAGGRIRVATVLPLSLTGFLWPGGGKVDVNCEIEQYIT